MGLVVWIINIVSTTPPDYVGALTAAAKQAVYTLFLGGFLIRLTTWLALRPGRPWLVFVTAWSVSTVVTSALIFLVHSLRGTPSPVLSSMPTAIMTLVLSPLLIVRIRRGLR